MGGKDEKIVNSMKYRFIILLFISLVTLTGYAKDDIKRPETYNFVRGIEAIQSNNYREAYDYLSKEISDNPNILLDCHN